MLDKKNVHPEFIQAIILFLCFMLFIRSIFKDLRDGGSPFSRQISLAAYLVAVGMLSNALHGGRLSFDLLVIFPAAVVGLIGFIFDYGRLLQEESDTTL